MFRKILLVIALLILSLIAEGAYYLYFASAPAKEEKIVFDTPIGIQEVPTSPEVGAITESGAIATPPRVQKSFTQFVPTFREVDLPFTHRYDKRGLPALGSSLIDVDGDGVEEVFIGGGYGQGDGLFFFEDGKFVDKISASGLSGDATTYGSFVVDSDSDGDSDILISREDGIYLYRNDGAGKFSEKKLDITLEKDSVVLSIAGGDIDRDGVLDLYLSTFIDAANLRTATFNDPVHAKANILLMGKGDDTYEDITEKSGAVFDQNTFVSSLVDLDSDGYPDIVIAPNTEKVTIYKNNGDLTFTRLPPVTGYGFWMGLALGDIDNDRDIDIFASNMGNTIPVKSARGDLRTDQVLDPEWRLIENLGNMQFQDATEKSGLLGYEFAWGAIFEDWNLDSHLDLIVAENYIKWPPHKVNKLAGRFFIGGADGVFRPTTTESRAENYAYGTTPLSGDFDADGYPDLIITNLDGKTKALLSDGGANKSLRVILPTSARYIGAILTMMSVDGTELTRVYAPAAGLYSSQSSHIIFPLAPSDSIESLSVSLMTGEKKVYDRTALDTMGDGKGFLRLPIF